MASLRRTRLILLLVLALGGATITAACNPNQDGGSGTGYHISQ